MLRNTKLSYLTKKYKEAILKLSFKFPLVLVAFVLCHVKIILCSVRSLFPFLLENTFMSCDF